MSNTQYSPMQSVVMRRVRTIRMLQSVITLEILSILVFLTALWGIGREVWVARVFHNAPALFNVPAELQFYIAAFADTRIIVQLLTLVVLASGVWLIIALVGFVLRSLRTTSRQFA